MCIAAAHVHGHEGEKSDGFVFFVVVAVMFKGRGQLGKLHDEIARNGKPHGDYDEKDISGDRLQRDKITQIG